MIRSAWPRAMSRQINVSILDISIISFGSSVMKRIQKILRLSLIASSLIVGSSAVQTSADENVNNCVGATYDLPGCGDSPATKRGVLVNGSCSGPNPDPQCITGPSA